jgi:hypothetical protein
MTHSFGTALVTGTSFGMGAVCADGSPSAAMTSSSWRETRRGSGLWRRAIGRRALS